MRTYRAAIEMLSLFCGNFSKCIFYFLIIVLELSFLLLLYYYIFFFLKWCDLTWTRLSFPGGFRAILTDQNKLVVFVGGVTALAAGVYTTR